MIVRSDTLTKVQALFDPSTTLADTMISNQHIYLAQTKAIPGIIHHLFERVNRAGNSEENILRASLETAGSFTKATVTIGESEDIESYKRRIQDTVAAVALLDAPKEMGQILGYERKADRRGILTLYSLSKEPYPQLPDGLEAIRRQIATAVKDAVVQTHPHLLPTEADMLTRATINEVVINGLDAMHEKLTAQAAAAAHVR